MNDNIFTTPLTTALITELNKSPKSCELAYLKIFFYEHNRRLYYKLTSSECSANNYLSNPFSFNQLPLDAKQLGARDTTIMVFVNQIAELYTIKLKQVIERWIFRRVNAETFDVLTLKTSHQSLQIDIGSDIATMTWEFVDPISSAAFRNLITVTSKSHFEFSPKNPITRSSSSQAPNYKLILTWSTAA
ncbi:hypothetical protein [Lactiplantibacillus plantarum]|uniref:hypothetical protein n=1 Tax=Lactiplantibacillus plantarum TaxID=1590 RepID=UPI0021A8678C|nr:hypothetical protein [Lactiplantibacillus plantarum]MCT3267858.1 hypothetical protein [Lactiplantibacillus plantarum]